MLCIQNRTIPSIQCRWPLKKHEFLCYLSQCSQILAIVDNTLHIPGNSKGPIQHLFKASFYSQEFMSIESIHWLTVIQTTVFGMEPNGLWSWTKNKIAYLHIKGFCMEYWLQVYGPMVLIGNWAQLSTIYALWILFIIQFKVGWIKWE